MTVASLFCCIWGPVKDRMWEWLVHLLAYTDQWRTGCESGWFLYLHIWTSEEPDVRVDGLPTCICGPVKDWMWEWLVSLLAYTDQWRTGCESGWFTYLHIRTSEGLDVRLAGLPTYIYGLEKDLVWDWLDYLLIFKDQCWNGCDFGFFTFT